MNQQIESTRFGAIEYSDSDVLTFTEGMLGFPDAKQFVLLSHKPESPFRWLQSVDEPSLAFLIAEPAQMVKDYSFEISDSLAAVLGVDDQVPPVVYATVSIPAGKPREMTMNLAGPILLSPRTGRAAQIVVEDSAYTTKHKVFQNGSAEVPQKAA